MFSPVKGIASAVANKAGLNYVIISTFSEAEMRKLEVCFESRPISRARPVEAVRLYGIKEYRSRVLLICRRAYKSGSELFDRLPHRNPGAEATRHQPHTKKVNP